MDVAHDTTKRIPRRSGDIGVATNLARTTTNHLQPDESAESVGARKKPEDRPRSISMT